MNKNAKLSNFVHSLVKDLKIVFHLSLKPTSHFWDIYQYKKTLYFFRYFKKNIVNNLYIWSNHFTKKAVLRNNEQNKEYQNCHEPYAIVKF